MKHFYYSLLSLLAAVVLLTACSKDKDGSAALKLIPEDAALVIRFDIKQAGEVLGYDKDKESKEELKKAVKSITDSKDLQKKLSEIIDNPSETGISSEHPIFFYVAPNLSNLVGLVGTTADKDKLTDLMKIISKEGKFGDVEEVDGVSYLSVKDAAIIVADDWFYFGVSKGDAEDMAKDMKKLVDDDKTPIMENKDFQAMMEKKGAIQMLISGKGLDAFVGKAAMFGGDGKQIKAALKQVLPGKLTDVSLLADVSYANGVGTGTCELLTYSTEWSNAVKDFDNVLGTITPALCKYLSADAFVMLANVDGNKLMSLIEKAAAKFGADINSEEFAAIRSVITSLKGDMGVAIEGAINDDMPLGVAYISTKDASVIDLLAAGGEENEDLRKNGENDYTMFSYDYDYNYETGDFEKTDLKGAINLGFRDGYTYFVFTDSASTQPFATPAKAMNAKNIKGKGFYGYMNSQFFNAIPGDNAMESEIMKEMASVFDYMEFYYEGNGKITGRSELKDKNTPLLKTYINMFKKGFDAGYSYGVGR